VQRATFVLTLLAVPLMVILGGPIVAPTIETTTASAPAAHRAVPLPALRPSAPEAISKRQAMIQYRVQHFGIAPSFDSALDGPALIGHIPVHVDCAPWVCATNISHQPFIAVDRPPAQRALRQLAG
jgi:hypothetical protein